MQNYRKVRGEKPRQALRSALCPNYKEMKKILRDFVLIGARERGELRAHFLPNVPIFRVHFST